MLREHLVDPDALRKADFDAFFDARRAALLGLIEQAMGKPAVRDLGAEHLDSARAVAATRDDDLEPDEIESVDADLPDNDL